MADRPQGTEPKSSACSDRDCGVRPAGAQVFQTLVHFRGADGARPLGPLIQGIDGNLYGTTGGVGRHPNLKSEIFRLTPDGTITGLHKLPLYSFGLIQTAAGSLYGVTASGGKYGAGPSLS